ncbi:MAG: class I SAM-dependent methyltransferase [Planctomycetes bacterium]|nr:class I SAM-dependent methyltransferase [Planctomycetota bacterium]
MRGPVFVDLACGDNRLVRTLGFGTGVDIKNHGNADIVHPDFTHLPFADGSVNTVTILAAINYFDNPEAALRDIRRILSHDGVLILTQLSKTLSGFWHVFRDRSLPRIAFSSRELKALIDATGLEVRAKRRFMLGVNTLYIIGRKHD